ncbi:SRPBCC domain-containing protein [bacterium]|nr:SRPBCC domain-containing protein [bacterium]
MSSPEAGAALPQMQFQQGTEIVQEIVIEAAAAQVWHALTRDIFSWWSHSFSDKPYLIALEAQVGGRFYELFDAEGNGALYGTVTFCKPGEKLAFSGQMGMQGPVINHCTFTLAEAEGVTRLRISQVILGMVAPEMVQGYTQGWAALLGQLRDFVSSGRKVRED